MLVLGIQQSYSYVCVYMCVCVCVCVRACMLNCTVVSNSVTSGCSIYGIFQARILERVAISYSKGIFTTEELQFSCVSYISRQILYQLCHLKSSLSLCLSLYMYVCVCVYIYNKICVCVTRVLFQTLVTYLLQNIEYSSLCYTIGLYWLWFYI